MNDISKRLESLTGHKSQMTTARIANNWGPSPTGCLNDLNIQSTRVPSMSTQRSTAKSI